MKGAITSSFWPALQAPLLESQGSSALKAENYICWKDIVFVYVFSNFSEAALLDHPLVSIYIACFALGAMCHIRNLEQKLWCNRKRKTSMLAHFRFERWK